MLVDDIVHEHRVPQIIVKAIGDPSQAAILPGEQAGLLS
jgi:hypothetical protein